MDDKLHQTPLPEEERLFSHLKAPLSVSREAVWEELSKQMEQVPPKQAKIRRLATFRLLAAACVALLFCIAFARFYTRELVVARGQTGSAILPDGSTVKLNAETQMSYHPYWWPMEREVTLEGEAFFQVEAGSRFSVVSRKGITSVLGTSFNIFARGSAYEVFCKTGKVEVTKPNGQQQNILKPGDFVAFSQAGVERRSLAKVEALDWTERRFYATDKPLAEVLRELERIYGISIEAEEAWLAGKFYSGNFKLPDAPRKALELISASFGASYSQLSPQTYSLNPKTNRP